MSTSLLNTSLNSKSSFAQPGQNQAKPSWLNHMHALAGKSESLVISKGRNFRIGGRHFQIPKYIFLGERGSGTPIEIAIFAGMAPREESASIAAAHLLIDLEWQPEIASNYVIFSYPVVNPRAYSALPPIPLNELFWQGSAEPEVIFLEKELRQHSFKGLLTFHVDPNATGFYATTPSKFFAREILWPAVRAATREVPIDPDPVRILHTTRSGRVLGEPKGRLSAVPDEFPRPFEITLHAPGSVPTGSQIGGFVSAAKAILREYRRMISYAQNL
jgi:hypothetical protein